MNITVIYSCSARWQQSGVLEHMFLFLSCWPLWEKTYFFIIYHEWSQCGSCKIPKQV